MRANQDWEASMELCRPMLRQPETCSLLFFMSKLSVVLTASGGLLRFCTHDLLRDCAYARVCVSKAQVIMEALGVTWSSPVNGWVVQKCVRSVGVLKSRTRNMFSSIACFELCELSRKHKHLFIGLFNPLHTFAQLLSTDLISFLASCGLSQTCARARHAYLHVHHRHWQSMPQSL
eukprot:1161511-Pelagomonas_calceolata.AAC.7